ncbi:neutral alpha-glucosidase AB-like isoform X1 [Ciona intestinalis]
MLKSLLCGVLQTRFKLLLIVMATMVVQETESFEQGNFKKCDQSSFCQRQRNYKPERSPYVAVFSSLRSVTDNHVYMDVRNNDNNIPFTLDIYALEDGMIRLRINELSPLKPRYEVPNTIHDVGVQNFLVEQNSQNQTITLRLSTNPSVSAVVVCDPFRLDIFDEQEPVFSINSRHLLKVEHLREKPVPKPVSSITSDAVESVQTSEGVVPTLRSIYCAWFSCPTEEPVKEETELTPEENLDNPEEVETKEETKEDKPDPDDEPGMWDETFKTHRDSKPRGPESIGLDTSFVNFNHVYGIPEHADKLALSSTIGSEPYRLYNLDVFEYDLNSRAALYGSIPFMIGHNAKRTVGLLWLNSAETWIDVDSSEDNKGVLGSVFSYFAGQENVPEVNIHWMSESGVIDIYFMVGPSPRDVMRQYTKLTGTTYFPPKWSIAYHQSRWNYKDEEDVKTVDAAFDEHDIPYDCLWLDIEHTDGKRYFTWDTLKFPNPIKMQDDIAAKGRKMVTIIDPHIKTDSNYHIYREAQAKGYFIQNKDGGEFKGWCWPGDSAYLDFTLPEVRQWWASQFTPDIYKGSTLNLFTWNDMNEPSVFNGPEITMHKDIKHGGGWEHRHVHNMYGILQQMSTVDGQIARSGGNERSFVLSRAFYIGTQKYGAIWTGDNTAEWGHLEYSVPMLLTIGLCGISHCGADVGGFFKNPDPELLTRWYQAAAYQPFFRAHAHIDTSRREPWLYDEQYKSAIRGAIRERYELMPYWYTLFYQSHMAGEPTMRPLWYEFPKDTELFAKDDSFMVGSALLVKPIATASTWATQVYLPGNNGWYDVKSYQFFPSPNTISMATPLAKIAVLQQGGTIIPRQLRVRRCSALMTHDPYTLYVALNTQGKADGEIYLDDGHTFDYRKGVYNYKKLTFENNVLSSRSLNTTALWETSAWLERVVVMGTQQPSTVTVEAAGVTTALGYSFDKNLRVLTIRKPGVNLQKDFTITIN